MTSCRRSVFTLVTACLSLLLAPPLATAGTVGDGAQEASIPFANRGGIRDWRVEDDSNLLLQDRQGQWYRARLQAPSYYLAYAGQLSFTTGPSGTLEKLDSVVVRGQRFPIVSLTKVAPPAKAVAKPVSP